MMLNTHFGPKSGLFGPSATPKKVFGKLPQWVSNLMQKIIMKLFNHFELWHSASFLGLKIVIFRIDLRNFVFTNIKVSKYYIMVEDYMFAFSLTLIFPS